jgi:acetyl-CoA acetyltransferase
MKEVVIVSACRTAVGSFGGTLASVPVVKLGEVVMREALARAGIEGDVVDDVIRAVRKQKGASEVQSAHVAVGTRQHAHRTKKAFRSSTSLIGQMLLDHRRNDRSGDTARDI